MPRVADLPCADCGKLMWRGGGSLPEGQARCQPCRRAGQKHGTRAKYRAGCRCEECRADQAARQRAYYYQVKERDGLTLKSKYGRTGPPVYCAKCGERLRYGGGGGGTTNSEYRTCVQCSKGRTLVPQALRLAVFERDGWTCQLCHEPLDRDASRNGDWQPTVDHIMPVSRGGAHELSNLRAAHRWCNVVRGTRDRHELFEEAW